MQAALQGWADYMSNVDVAQKVNAAILQDNQNLPSQANWYAWDKQRQFVTGFDAAQNGIGTMSQSRWDATISEIKSLGGLTKSSSLPAASVFTLDYLPKVVPPTSLPAAPSGSY
jgi:NitT/TauT family transport system substrate-binding protein